MAQGKLESLIQQKSAYKTQNKTNNNDNLPDMNSTLFKRVASKQLLDDMGLMDTFAAPTT